MNELQLWDDSAATSLRLWLGGFVAGLTAGLPIETSTETNGSTDKRWRGIYGVFKSPAWPDDRLLLDIRLHRDSTWLMMTVDLAWESHGRTVKGPLDVHLDAPQGYAACDATVVQATQALVKWGLKYEDIVAAFERGPNL